MDGIVFSDVPREVVAEVGRAAADFSVGFATIRKGDHGDNVVLGGSGTLIRIDDMYGVLTADHVLKYLPADQHIGVIIPTGSEPLVHRFTLAKDAFHRLRVGHPGDGHYTRKGPDISLLLISTLDAWSLGARKSFYDLSARYDEILRNLPGRTDGLWVVCGFVDEFTTDHGPDRGFSAIKGFHGGAAAVWVKSEHVSGDFDYCEFEVGYDGPDRVPRRFGGLSGGGLWHARLCRGEDGRVTPQRPVLGGVVFYESIQGDGRTIITCHSWRSIYARVVGSARAKAS